MPAKPGPPPAPLTFDLPDEHYARLVELQERLGLPSVSAVVRHILDAFDFAGIDRAAASHRQISVRLPARERARLARVARQKRMSAGEALRHAIAGFETPTGPRRRR